MKIKQHYPHTSFISIYKNNINSKYLQKTLLVKPSFAYPYVHPLMEITTITGTRISHMINFKHIRIEGRTIKNYIVE